MSPSSRVYSRAECNINARIVEMYSPRAVLLGVVVATKAGAILGDQWGEGRPADPKLRLILHQGETV